MKKGGVLVVGGAGYIGAHVCKLLHKKNIPFIVLDNLSTGHKDFVKWSPFIHADLSDKTAIENCFKEYSIQTVMHFSAIANVADSVIDPASYYQNNVVNTLNLLDIMKKYQVFDFIFSSTCATYGIPQTDTLNETHPQNPINPYGVSKLMIEQIVKDYAKAYGLRYGFLRYFNAAGADPDAEIGEAHSPETHLIPLAIEALQGKRDALTVFGNDYPTPDGTCIRDYIHVNDLADAHIKLFHYLQAGNPNTAINLGMGHGNSVLEILATIETVTGKKVPYAFGSRREGDPPILVANNRKAQEVLGWAPEYTLEDIISTAWKWHQ